MAADSPHSGLRVLELSRVLAGPWIGQTLADFGADVIKVESRDGDDTRRWGPPFVDYADGDRDAAYFHACNRGKRSIALDFSDTEDLAVLKRLAARADVVIENFKVGSLVRFGLDADSLRMINPRLIYCSVTGFGQDGPYADRPGYDFVVQAMGGLMHLTGAADGPPQKVGVAFADIFTGLYGVIAIQAALARRERTGAGETIDLALLDTMVGVLANQAQNFLVSGHSPVRQGNVHPNIAPYQLLPAADGEIAVAIGNEGQFARFCAAIGLEALVDDARFSSNADRLAHRAELEALCSRETSKLTRATMQALFDVAKIPAGPINDIAEVFADPQVQARAMRIDLPAGTRTGTVAGIRTPILMGGKPCTASRPSPRLDADRATIIAELEQVGA